MKNTTIRCLCAFAFAGVTSIAVANAGDLCNVAEADRQPMETLQTKLEGEGFMIKNVKVDDGCYEVYATNADGERVENHYNPATFELVKSE